MAGGAKARTAVEMRPRLSARFPWAALAGLVLVGAALLPARCSNAVPDDGPAAAAVQVTSSEAGIPEPAESAEMPSSSVGPLPESVSSSSGRIVASSVGLDAPLGRMAVTDGAVDPSRRDTAYVVDGYGTPGEDDGTAYVVMHSGRGTSAIENALVDLERGEPAMEAGDVVSLDGLSYVVGEVRLVGKSELSRDPAVWEQETGRVVLITCLPAPSGPSTKNVVVTLQRAS